MNTRHSNRWFWPALAVVCLTVLVSNKHNSPNTQLTIIDKNITDNTLPSK